MTLIISFLPEKDLDYSSIPFGSMGEHKISIFEDAEGRKNFIDNLLKDIDALKHILENGMVEEGITRIGAE